MLLHALITVPEELPPWADMRVVFVELSIRAYAPVSQGWLRAPGGWAGGHVPESQMDEKEGQRCSKLPGIPASRDSFQSPNLHFVLQTPDWESLPPGYQ